MVPQKRFLPSIPAWVLLPLRLFLGLTFVYAGVQKLTDVQFLHPGTPGFLGRQLATLAASSPLHALLVYMIIPNAQLFGFLVSYGEVAIGLGTVFGLLFRPAAFFGFLINLIFFLTITWGVSPYFYGSDIVFCFCWLTLLLNGPLHTGLPSFDELLAPPFVQNTSRLGSALRFVLGIPIASTQPTPPITLADRSYQLMQRLQPGRRSFLFGLAIGGLSMFSLMGILFLAFQQRTNSAQTGTSATVDNTPATSTAQSAATPTSTVEAVGTPAKPNARGVIAQVNAVPRNSATSFILPASGDPGILVHTAGDQFVAFNAHCTHAGCEVDYDASLQLLACPCHGARFDPAQEGAVIHGPAATPLNTVAITVDSVTGEIALRST